MTLDSYLFEKACYLPDGLASVAEDLRLLSSGSPAQEEIGSHLNVALRHSLSSCCAIAGASFVGDWVIDVSRRGRSAWKSVVQPALEDALFGPDERDERIKASGLPRDHASDDEAREIDVEEVLPRAAKALAALLDLVEVVRRHNGYDLKDASFRSNLSHSMNGATKVIATLIGAEWQVDWPVILVDHGREALPAVLAALAEGEEAWRFSAAELEALQEAWLSGADPVRTPEAEREAERRRRAKVTKRDRMPHDLVIPKRYRSARLEGLLVERDPGHQACYDYARAPDGTLILHGELASGLFEIQWAIARYWFVDELHSVGAVDWHRVVEDNVMAQNRGLWECPRLIIESLSPVFLPGGSYADPGYAERMLEYRSMRGYPTVITIERYGLEMVNLRSRTIDLLKQSKNVVLSRLSPEEREGSEMFT